MNNKLITAMIGALLITGNAFAKPADCKVNINTATAVQLEDCLDKVGEKLADAIVEWRSKQLETNAAFVITDVEQMVGKVSRWGKKTAEINKGKVCFTDECVNGKPATTPAPATEPAPKAAPAPATEPAPSARQQREDFRREEWERGNSDR
jgi:competence ComEA-like helix-hairpin-helix protein